MIGLNRGYTDDRDRQRPAAVRGMARAFIALAVFAMALGLGNADLAARQYAAIIVDAKTGAVLHAENAELKNRPASLTKMMTLYLVFEALRDGRLSLGQMLNVSSHASSQSPTKLNLRPFSKISVEDAILATVTKSANDAAVVLAEACGKSEAAFARLMTSKARALGMNGTRFYNASGLPHDQQITTARDMATLANALYSRFPQYKHFFATPEFRYRHNVYRNHNRLLGTYHGVDGIKTGYTNASGFNLVTSVTRNGRHVYAVVLGGATSQGRDNQMRKLLDRTFGKSDKNTRPVTASYAQPKTKNARVAAAKKHPSLSASKKRWSIQVGTFKGPERALARARQAKMVAPTFLLPAAVKIETMSRANKTVYRARFTGLSEANARQTCRILTSKNFTCMAARVT